MAEVFTVDTHGARVRSDALGPDGRLRSDLLNADEARFLEFVADGCPPHIIHVG
jgi:hypothetical protein